MNNKEELTFNDAKYAQSVLEENGKILSKMKLALLIALASQGLWILASTFDGLQINIVIHDILTFAAMGAALAAAIASYVIGGGVGRVLKMSAGMAKGIMLFGFVAVPFPVNLFAGIICLPIALFPFVLIPFFPLLIVFLNYRSVKKEYKAAEEYLNYCD